MVAETKREPQKVKCPECGADDEWYEDYYICHSQSVKLLYSGEPVENPGADDVEVGDWTGIETTYDDVSGAERYVCKNCSGDNEFEIPVARFWEIPVSSGPPVGLYVAMQAVCSNTPGNPRCYEIAELDVYCSNCEKLRKLAA